MDDTRALVRGELLALNAEIGRILSRVTDRLTRLHLQDAQDRISKALDPRRAALK